MRTGTRLVIALALAATMGWQATGQTNASSGAPQKRAEEPPRLSVRFTGGTVAEYVRSLREASPLANIVVSPEASGVVLPEIILHEVDLSTAASAVESIEDLGDGRYRAVTVRPFGPLGNAFRINSEGGSRRTDRGQPAPSASAWSLSSLVASGYSADQILAAIQVGQAMFDEPATIKYHEPTKLLVARASNEQLALISQTLAQLRQNQPSSDAEAGIRNDIARQQEWLATTTRKLETVQVRLVQVRRDLAADDAQQAVRSRMSVEARGRLETELRELERQIEDLLQNKRQAEIGISQHEMRLEAARNRQ